MRNGSIFLLPLFMTWFASAAEEPAPEKFCVALVACSPDQEHASPNFYVHASVHNRYESTVHRLQQEYERERHFRRLQNYCAYNQIDPVWASPQAHNVRTRCTTINFLNGPAWSYQELKPSSLPPDFYDSFRSVDIFSHMFWGNQSAAKYYEYFFSKLNKRRILEGFPEALPYARAEMRQWGYYEYEGFRSFLKQLPVYESYIFEIAAQLEYDAEFASLVREASLVAADYIPQEAQRIRALQSQRAEEERRAREISLNNQQQHCAQQLFVQQRERLAERAIVWETTHPERAVAYHKTFAENGVRSQQQYQLSSEAHTILRQMSLASSEYAQLTGNSLQHELMQELIAGVEQNAQISPHVVGSTAQLLHKHSLYSFDHARQANEIGDCDGTVQLIDFGNQLLECCKAFVQGAVDGIKTGTIDAVVGMLEVVQHPIETVQAFTETANMLVHLAYEYIPTLPDHDLSLEEYDAYLQRCHNAEQKWNTVYTQLQQKWRETPAPELVYQVTHGTASIGTNIFVAHSCTKLVCSLARSLRPIVVTAVTKLKRKVSQFELQRTVPGFLLPPESKIAKICQTARVSMEVLKAFHSDYMKAIEREIAILQPLFDNTMKGFAEFTNKYLKINYAHIFGIELTFDSYGRAILSGFHHDLMNTVENSGMIEFLNKVIDTRGVYEVDLKIGEKIIRGKTFFPAHWSRERVIQSIYEAYENCNSHGGTIELCPDGKYRLTGKVQEGIEIEMFITKKGKITTAYPLM